MQETLAKEHFEWTCEYRQRSARIFLQQLWHAPLRPAWRNGLAKAMKRTRVGDKSHLRERSRESRVDRKSERAERYLSLSIGKLWQAYNKIWQVYNKIWQACKPAGNLWLSEAKERLMGRIPDGMTIRLHESRKNSGFRRVNHKSSEARILEIWDSAV